VISEFRIRFGGGGSFCLSSWEALSVDKRTTCTDAIYDKLYLSDN